MTAYDELRQRHFADAMAQLPGHVARLDWPAGRIADERNTRLRSLVRSASERSPWHRARLAGLRLQSMTVDRLADVPPMTKVDLLSHFDEIVTDPRLSLRLVEDHLERLTSDAYIFDEFHAITSGGSSGVRRADVYDWWGWATYFACLRGRGIHLNHDLVIVEPVDLEGRPVPPGERSDKIYITNLFNTLLPLIRFEVTDEITVIPETCPCGSAHTWIEEVQGRLDEGLTYPGGLTVHPIVLRSPLGRQRNVAEYQVRQTQHGVDVHVRLVGDVDLGALRAEIASGLARVGMANPEVVLTPVDHLARQASGKVKRIVPLRAISETADGAHAGRAGPSLAL